MLAALLLMLAVLVSNFVSKMLPRVSTPLIQIALGVLLAFFVPVPADFELPTELFMMLFVAPLIYADSRGIDRLTAWRNRRTVLILSIGLVVATTVAIGWVMGVVVPQLPLAAAFVLGAALSPTDAVAVPSLAHTSAIDARQRTVLTAESIVNDATGVVMFNLALAALVTGAFSVMDAGASFAVLFFGGIAAGLVVGVAGNLASSLVRRLGCDDVVFHVLFDVSLPFVAFLVGEVTGVSPIMAVMVCALSFKVGIGEAGPSESRVNIVSSSVWNVLSFALNGVVFVLLGLQLKGSIQDVLGTGIAAGMLAAMVVLMAALLYGLRFAWVVVMERRQPQPLRSAAVLTFAGGVKGAVTMSIALSIPYAVGARSLVVFLVSMAIIISTLLANVLVPLLAPAPRQTRDERAEGQRRAQVEVLRTVVERLHAERTMQNEAATRAVVADYNRRIRNLSANLSDEEEGSSRREVRLFALDLEARRCTELMDLGEVDARDGYRYLVRVGQLKKALTHRTRLSWLFQRNLRRARGMLRATLSQAASRLGALLGGEGAQAPQERGLQRRCAEYVIACLTEEVRAGRFPVEDVTQVLMEYRRAVELLDLSNPSLTTIAHRSVLSEQIKLRAVGYELEAIRDAQERGDITRETAMRMRDSAYLMRLDLENLV